MAEGFLIKMLDLAGVILPNRKKMKDVTIR